MKYKIEKLLNSPMYEDVLLGIELSFELPIQDFENIFHEKVNFGNKRGDKFIRFARNEKEYHMNWFGHLFIYFHVPADFKAKPDWINLGHKEN